MPKLTKRNIVLFILSFVLLLPNFLAYHLYTLPAEGNNWEVYDQALSTRITSIENLLAYADSIKEKKGIEKQTLEYGNIISAIVRKRFYHGYSHYALNENWLAALTGKLIWDDLSAIVLPADIMKYPMAACSQQSIVMMECFKRIGVSYRKVGFDHHYALEGKFNGRWYFFDTNLEPDFSKFKRTSIDSLIKERALDTIYKGHLDSTTLKWGLANPSEGVPNIEPAPRAALFHKVTYYLSRLLFLFPLMFLFIKRKKHKSISVTKKNESSLPIV